MIEWRTLFLRRRRERAILDAKTPLAVRRQDGTAALSIPNWQRIRLLELLLFYRDGSVLAASLGWGDKLRVIRGEPESQAANKVSSAKSLLHRSTQRMAWRAAWRVVVGLAMFVIPLASYSVLFPRYRRRHVRVCGDYRNEPRVFRINRPLTSTAELGWFRVAVVGMDEGRCT